jgi:hypothetical protein
MNSSSPKGCRNSSGSARACAASANSRSRARGALGEAEVERAGLQAIERRGDVRRRRGRERGREARLGAAGGVDHVTAEEDHAARLQAARQDGVGGGHCGSPVVDRCCAHSGAIAPAAAIGAL